MNVFKLSRENEFFERGKLNSRCFQCFHWFPAAMLESLRRAPTWRLRVECFHRHAIKIKIKNHSVDKVKKL